MISNWKRKVFGYTAQGGSGGGSSGGGQAAQSNQYSNISPWIQPYVSSILGAAQQQVFNMSPGTTTPGTPAVPAQYDDQGNLIPGTGIAAVPSSTSAPTINGINPYTAYGQNGAGMSASDQAAAQASVAGFTPLQQQSFNTAANMQVPGQYNQASNLAGTAGINALQSSGTAGQYGQMGSQAGQQAAGLSNMYGQGAIGQGQQGAAIGQSLGQQATNPGSLSAYMNPYIQNSLNPQLQLLNQQTGINSAAEQGAATSSGAFGGSREALANSLTQQTGNLAAQQAIAQGYNTAFTNAQQEMNAANQAALAGNAQAQTGYGQGLTAAQQAGQLGISGANAGLAGVQGQQAGYGLAGTQANNLANIGTQSLAAQQGIAGLQNTYGTQQQQNQQNVINQAMQNYQTAQQYPMQQLSQLNSLLAGKPITDVTTTQQAAAPTTFGQITGLGLTGLGAYGAANSGTTINTNVPTSKKGGVIKKSKKYSMGGIVELSLYNAMKGQS